MKALCSFMFGGHVKCKNEVHQLKTENISLINQIQELKAINHYQMFDLEQKITQLEELLSLRAIEVELLEKENHALKDKIEARRKKRADKMRAKREQKEKQ